MQLFGLFAEQGGREYLTKEQPWQKAAVKGPGN
jgi:hypothetical protein